MKQTVPHLVGVFLLASSVSAQSLEIDHVPIACAVAEKFARLEARFTPLASVAVARVVFQGDNASEWYSVAMTRAESGFIGVLPKPKKSLKAFRYYIEVTDKAIGTNRTPEHTTSVVDSSSACKGKVMAGTVVSASVVVQGPAGSVVVPPGFASAGVVSGAAAGAAVAGAAVAGGGGLSGGALIGIVAGVGGAAAAGVAVAGKGGGDSGPGASGASPSSTPSSTSYTGPFNGQFAIVLLEAVGSVVTCTGTSSFAGTAMVTLDQTSGAANGRIQTNGSHTQISGSCLASVVLTWTAPLTGTAGSLSARSQQGPTTSPGVALVTMTNVFEFSGALSGGVITGTLTFTQSQQGLRVDGSRFGGDASVTVPVTLR